MNRVLKYALMFIAIYYSMQYIKAETINLNSSNSIVIRGPIDVYNMNLVQLQLQNLVMLRGKEKYPLFITLDSGGGDVDAALNFIEFAKTIPNLHTITLKSFSAANHIAQVMPGTRYTTSIGEYLAHSTTITIRGGVDDGTFLVRYKNMLESLKILEVVISKRMKLSLKEYKELIKSEYLCYGTNCIDKNFADKVVDIKCSDELIKQNTQILYNRNILVFSACPLFKFPIR